MLKTGVATFLGQFLFLKLWVKELQNEVFFAQLFAIFRSVLFGKKFSADPQIFVKVRLNILSVNHAARFFDKWNLLMFRLQIWLLVLRELINFCFP